MLRCSYLMNCPPESLTCFSTHTASRLLWIFRPRYGIDYATLRGPAFSDHYEGESAAVASTL